AAAHPWQSASITQLFVNSAQVGAQLCGMVLHMPKVLYVQLAARDWFPGEAGRSLQRPRCFGGKSLQHSVSADFQVRKCLVFAQSRAQHRLSLITASFMNVSERERVFG